MRRKLAAGAAVAGVVLCTASPAWGQEAINAEDVQVNLDNAFVLLSAVLVIFMQAGFALVEAGLTRAKSVANIMMKNLMDFCAGVIAACVVVLLGQSGHRGSTAMAGPPIPGPDDPIRSITPAAATP